MPRYCFCVLCIYFSIWYVSRKTIIPKLYKFYQNRLINEYVRKIFLKDRRKDGVFLWDVEKLTFLIILKSDTVDCCTQKLKGLIQLNKFSRFFWIKFSLPPEIIKRKETKMVLFCTLATHLPALNSSVTK